MTTKTPGQLATEKAREASIRAKKVRAAERHRDEHIAALRLLGYTVIAPE